MMKHSPSFWKEYFHSTKREIYIYIYLLNRHVIVLFCFFPCRLSDWRFRNKIINTLKNQKCGSHIISTIQATDIVAMNPIQRSFVLAVIVIIPYIGLGIWLSSSLRTDSIRHFHKPSNPASEKKHYSTKELRLLAKELSETQRSLQHSQLLFYRLEKHIQLVKELIISIDGNLTDDLKKDNSVDRSSVNSLPKREVCAEKFMAPSWEYVFPRFRKGFDRVNCSDFVPLDQLVTMIVTSPEEISTENLQYSYNLQ